MKLSILVEYLEQLESVLSENPTHALDHYLNQITKLACNHDIVRWENHALSVNTICDDIHNQLTTLHRTVGHLKQDISRQINQITSYYRTSSLQRFRIYETKISNELSALDRRPVLSQEAYSKLANRIRSLQGWTYPGLVVRPGNANWLEDFRTDPIYVVDHSQELIDPAVTNLPLLTQQRLCRYTVSEIPSLGITPVLPAEQFGVSLIYFYFNFRPLEIIYQWLNELWRITRPSGRVLFTYNDCDRSHGIQLFESRYMSFTPGRLIKEYATNLGFEILDDCYLGGDCSWLELSKPGTMITQRAAQCLAKVVARSK